jgi:uncharacterized protein
MATDELVGTVAELWRFPVKSMRGEQLSEVAVTERGVLGDRAYALIDVDTARVVSAKSVKLFPGLLNCKAKFVEPPGQEGGSPAVQISLPDGQAVRSDSGDVDSVLSAYFRRNVSLRQSAPEDFTIRMLKEPIPVAIEMPWSRRNSGRHCLPLLGWSLRFPLALLTSSTLTRLSELQPQTRFDLRRFRMNIILKTKRPGFVENDWVGHALGLGNGAKLNVALLDPRCVMTTLAQDDLPQDTDVLRTLVRHNRVQLGELGQFPCAGVYAVVAAPGTVQTGDQVTLN